MFHQNIFDMPPVQNPYYTMPYALDVAPAAAAKVDHASFVVGYGQDDVPRKRSSASKDSKAMYGKGAAVGIPPANAVVRSPRHSAPAPPTIKTPSVPALPSAPAAAEGILQQVHTVDDMLPAAQQEQYHAVTQFPFTMHIPEDSATTAGFSCELSPGTIKLRSSAPGSQTQIGLQGQETGLAAPMPMPSTAATATTVPAPEPLLGNFDSGLGLSGMVNTHIPIATNAVNVNTLNTVNPNTVNETLHTSAQYPAPNNPYVFLRTPLNNADPAAWDPMSLPQQQALYTLSARPPMTARPPMASQPTAQPTASNSKKRTVSARDDEDVEDANPNPTKKRSERWDVSPKTRNFLEGVYAYDHAPSKQVKKELARMLGVERDKIASWCSNRQAEPSACSIIPGYVPPDEADLAQNERAMQDLFHADIEILPTFILRFGRWTRALSFNTDMIDYAMGLCARTATLFVITIHNGTSYRLTLPLAAMEELDLHNWKRKEQIHGTLAFRAFLAPKSALYERFNRMTKRWEACVDFTGGENVGYTPIEVSGYKEDIKNITNKLKTLRERVVSETASAANIVAPAPAAEVEYPQQSYGQPLLSMPYPPMQPQPTAVSGPSTAPINAYQPTYTYSSNHPNTAATATATQHAIQTSIPLGLPTPGLVLDGQFKTAQSQAHAPSHSPFAFAASTSGSNIESTPSGTPLVTPTTGYGSGPFGSFLGTSAGAAPVSPVTPTPVASVNANVNRSEAAMHDAPLSTAMSGTDAHAWALNGMGMGMGMDVNNNVPAYTTVDDFENRWLSQFIDNV